MRATCARRALGKFGGKSWSFSGDRFAGGHALRRGCALQPCPNHPLLVGKYPLKLAAVHWGAVPNDSIGMCVYVRACSSDRDQNGHLADIGTGTAQETSALLRALAKSNWAAVWCCSAQWVWNHWQSTRTTASHPPTVTTTWRGRTRSYASAFHA